MASLDPLHVHWMKFARESERAALMVLKACPRSATSRAYYAGYQAMSAALQYVGTVKPFVDRNGRRRDAWPHGVTPELVRVHLAPILKNRSLCRDLKSRMGRLYKLREIADYVSGIPVDQRTANVAAREGSYLLKVATKLLPREQE